MFLELDSKILKFSLKSGQCRLFQGSSSRQSLFLVVQVAPFMQRDCHLLENQDTVTRSKGLSFKFFQLSIRRLQCAQKAAQGTQEDVSAITDKLVPQRCHDRSQKTCNYLQSPVLQLLEGYGIRSRILFSAISFLARQFENSNWRKLLLTVFFLIMMLFSYVLPHCESCSNLFAQ